MGFWLIASTAANSINDFYGVIFTEFEAVVIAAWYDVAIDFDSYAFAVQSQHDQ